MCLQVQQNSERRTSSLSPKIGSPLKDSVCPRWSPVATDAPPSLHGTQWSLDGGNPDETRRWAAAFGPKPSLPPAGG